MKKELWYAVNRSGQGMVFMSKPEWDDRLGIWVGRQSGCVSAFFSELEYEGFFAPPLQKCSDPPTRIILSLDIS